jgi:hypothetical protein
MEDVMRNCECKNLDGDSEAYFKPDQISGSELPTVKSKGRRNNCEKLCLTIFQTFF